MSGYLPHTDADRAAMLDTIGVDSVGDLFHDIPEGYRFPGLDLPDGRFLFVLPGPPGEFAAVLNEEIVPWLRQQFPDTRRGTILPRSVTKRRSTFSSL